MQNILRMEIVYFRLCGMRILVVRMVEGTNFTTQDLESSKLFYSHRNTQFYSLRSVLSKTVSSPSPSEIIYNVDLR